ncbi:MAG: hypothetical protein ACXVE1_13080 [Gaiellaceae bacterium]
MALSAGFALAVAAPAQAKELSAFNACGVAGCKTVKDTALLRKLIRSVEAQGNPISVPIPAPTAYLRLEFWIRGDQAHGPTFVQYYAPSRGLVLLQTDPDAWTWVKVGDLRPLLYWATLGVTPFAKPRISRVTIGGKPVEGPASYARLFTLQGKAESLPDEPDWQPIRIVTGRPGPWSSHAATLEYSPSKNVLWRSIQFVKVPNDLGRRLEAGRSLDAPGGDSFPWVLLLGGAGTAAVIVPGTFLYRRREPR